MKVLNLHCANGHRFEGWFASEDDYQAQNGRAEIECPLCADKVTSRLPSAPRPNLSGAREAPPSGQQPKQMPSLPVPVADADPQALWMRAVRHVLANTEDVGERF